MMGAVVPTTADPLLGRDKATDLVRTLITRPPHNRTPSSRDQPVLVCQGARGSGKTAFLGSLAAQLDQGVPYAWLDFATNRQASVPEVLSALAFELSRQCPNYPRLRFGRLVIGLVVLAEQLDLSNHALAYAQVRQLLEQHHGAHWPRRLLRSFAADVAVFVRERTGLPVETLLGDVPDAVVDAAARLPWTRSVVLGSAHNWYGEQGRGLRGDGIDELIELNRLARNDPESIDELLLDAFLADLRAEVGDIRKAKQPVANCVLLLDNVDTALGKRFLGLLVSARTVRAAANPFEPEPLTVIATSRGGLLAEIAPVEIAESSGDAAALARLLDRRGGPERYWLRYQLPDLSRDEVAAMVRAMTLRQRNNRRLTALVWQLTGGHPASTQLLLNAIAKRPEHRDEPTRLLAQAEPDDHAGADRRSVAERLLVGLLGDFPTDAVTDLITCAAAATREHAVRLATEDDRLPDGTPLLTGSTARYLAVVDPVLWPAGSGAGPVLLRRLLLGKLAQRGTDPHRAGTSGRRPEWTEVFGWHRDRCAQAKDEPGELYYALANGDLGAVAPILLRRLTELPAAAWLEEFRFVIQAPHRPHYGAVPAGTPTEEVDELTGDLTGLDRPLASMTRLLAVARLLACPLTGSRRNGPHLEAATGYEDLAALSPSGRELLFSEAQAHRHQAEAWN